MKARQLLPLALGVVAACSSGAPASPVPNPEAAEPAAAAEAEPAPTKPAQPAILPQPPLDEEACGQIVVVAYAGAKLADPKVTRSKQEARDRAEQLLARYKDEGDFPSLAASESDAPTSAARGGVMGTYEKDKWPELHGALRDPLFGLALHAVAPQPVEAPYGYVLLRRCPVEKARSRHILVRYAGAKKAGDDITRDKAAAQARAQELLAELKGGADFAELAKRASDDSSAERGGDVGNRGRGVLAKAYEDALFGMKPGDRRGAVESEFGFHIIERLPNEEPPK